MSENETPTIPLRQPVKDPTENSANKLRDALGKEYQTKIDAQLKVVIDAAKALRREKEKLQEIIEASRIEKESLQEVLKDII